MITDVYTDGSASNNGKPGCIAGYGVFFGDNDERNISEPFLLAPLTNNRAELYACIKAIEQYVLEGNSTLVIHSDSRYVIDSLTKWIHKWKKKGWKTSKNKPVKNKDLICQLDRLITLYTNDDMKFIFKHVSAHGKKIETDERRYGNDMADLLATQGTKKNTS